MPTRQEREAIEWLQRLGDTSDWWIKRACERFGIDPTPAMVDQIRMEATKR
jgi:hypothetical protein